MSIKTLSVATIPSSTCVRVIKVGGDYVCTKCSDDKVFNSTTSTCDTRGTSNPDLYCNSKTGTTCDICQDGAYKTGTQDFCCPNG